MFIEGYYNNFGRRETAYLLSNTVHRFFIVQILITHVLRKLLISSCVKVYQII